MVRNIALNQKMTMNLKGIMEKIPSFYWLFCILVGYFISIKARLGLPIYKYILHPDSR